MNFRRFDPTYISQGKKGLQRGGKLECGTRFASEPIELPRTAKAIRQLVTKREIPIADQDEEEDFAEAEEGRIPRGCIEAVNAATSWSRGKRHQR